MPLLVKPVLAAAVNEVPRPDSLPGGELVAAVPVSYVAFDVLAIAGEDLTSDPWRARRAHLEELMAGARPPLQLSPATMDRDDALVWFETWAPAGIEGATSRSTAPTANPTTSRRA